MRAIASAVELEQVISEFVDGLRQRIQVEAVVLYGSYVTGIPHEWSDIDIAVVSSDFEGMSLPQRQKKLSRLRFGCDRRISPIGFPSSEYHSPGPHSFLREIIRTGRVVYEHDTHAVPVLGGPDEEGLVRQRLQEPGRRVDGASFLAEIVKEARRR